MNPTRSDGSPIEKAFFRESTSSFGGTGSTSSSDSEKLSLKDEMLKQLEVATDVLNKRRVSLFCDLDRNILDPEGKELPDFWKVAEDLRNLYTEYQSNLRQLTRLVKDSNDSTANDFKTDVGRAVEKIDHPRSPKERAFIEKVNDSTLRAFFNEKTSINWTQRLKTLQA